MHPRSQGTRVEAQDRRRHAATYASRSGVPIEIVSQVPLPMADFRQVFAVFVDVLLVLDQLVLELLLQVDALVAGLRQAVDGVHSSL